MKWLIPIFMSLGKSTFSKKKSMYIYFWISLQEIDPSAQSYVWYDPTIQNEWVAKILDCLNENGEQYYKVEAKQLVTILLIVIAKNDHKPYISEVSSNYVGIGALNMVVCIHCS
jgi:phosphatidylinositol-bisphosphatase